MEKKDILDMKLSEFVQKSLDAGLVPILKFVDKDSISVMKLSPAQMKVVEMLRQDPHAYILKTRFWDLQRVYLSNGQVKYFNKKTLEVLEKKKVIIEFEKDKFRLVYYPIN